MSKIIIELDAELEEIMDFAELFVTSVKIKKSLSVVVSEYVAETSPKYPHENPDVAVYLPVVFFSQSLAC